MSRSRASSSAFLSTVAVALLLALPVGAAGTRSSGRRYTGTIAFLIDGRGLWVANADGSGESAKSLTPPGMGIDEYAWSPNGSLIAFIDDENHSLWMVRPDGTGLTQLLTGPDFATYNLSWSPDGKEIASVAQTSAQGSCAGKIYVVPIDGSPPSVVPGPTDACGVAWSPTGNQIAYWGSGIGVVHPDGSGLQQVSRRGFGWVRWSADGKQIAFGLDVHVRKGFGLYRGIGVVGADGTHFHVVTKNAYNEYPAAWSPRGRRILYGRANRGGIYVIGANGRNDHRVTSDSPPGSLFPALAWSPNGDSIAYAAPTWNRASIYLVGVDGHGKFRLAGCCARDPSWIAP